MSFTEIKACRICGNPMLDPVMDLGRQALTGVFPAKGGRVSVAPLELVLCRASSRRDACGLVQLRHSVGKKELYGKNYGYRSGLNRSMVEHLRSKVDRILRAVPLVRGDLVVDIGSNDGTLLGAYPKRGLRLAGVDPVGGKFKRFYPPGVRLLPGFFSAGLITRAFGRKKAKAITSIAMFYDLESPMDFMRQVREVLADDGIWVLEQSYLPSMLDMNAYDTICHEHLEYYRLRQIKWMTDRLGLKIIDVEINPVNGGSFSVTLARSDSRRVEESAMIDDLLRREDRRGLSTLRAFRDFRRRVSASRDALRKFVRQVNRSGKRVFGYGASTKGNVVLQFCGLTRADVPFIAEINPDKFGRVTPGSGIPIISEREARAMKPDYFLVLPWHFKDGIIERERAYLRSGGRLVFPLPALEVHSA